MSCPVKTELREDAEDSQIASTLEHVNNFGCTFQIKTEPKEFECNSESLHHSVDLKEVPFELNREEWEDIFIGQNSEELEVTNTDIFSEAEVALNLKIPTALKNMLIANGYECEAVIANITERNLEEIELFARNDLHRLIKKEYLHKYYGLYSKNPLIFKIISGHKHIIFMLAKYFRDKITCTQKSRKIVPRPPSAVSCAPSTSSDNLLTTPQSSTINFAEENLAILKNLKMWTKSKANGTKWESLKDCFEKLKIATSLNGNGNYQCAITCFCSAVYRIPKLSKKGSNAKRWIYSNFQTHLLKKHIEPALNSSYYVCE